MSPFRKVAGQWSTEGNPEAQFFGSVRTGPALPKGWEEEADLIPPNMQPIGLQRYAFRQGREIPIGPELEAEIVIAGFGKWIKDRPDPPAPREGKSTVVPSLNTALAENAALRADLAELQEHNRLLEQRLTALESKRPAKAAS